MSSDALPRRSDRMAAAEAFTLLGVLVARSGSSVLFGLANTEQGNDAEDRLQELDQEWDLHEEVRRHRGPAASARGGTPLPPASAAARTTTVPNS